MMRLDRIGQSRGAKGVALLIVFLTHATYIFNGFTWLDHGDILTGRALPMPGHLLEAMVARYGETSFYRPVVTLTLWLDSVVYGERSWGFHLTNVLLHVGVCASFIWAMQRVVVLPTWAILCGMVVAGVHPLSWLSVGAISYRPDLLAVLCSLLALGCYAEYRLSSGASAKLFGVAAFAALSLLSKETALFWVPALFLVWEYSTRKGTRSSRDVALVWGAVLVVAAAYVALRLVAVPEGWSRTSVPLHSAEEVGTRLAAVARQLQYVFDPRLPELSDAVPIVGLGVGGRDRCCRSGIHGRSFSAMAWNPGRMGVGILSCRSGPEPQPGALAPVHVAPLWLSVEFRDGNVHRPGGRMDAGPLRFRASIGIRRLGALDAIGERVDLPWRVPFQRRCGPFRGGRRGGSTVS